MRSPRIVVFSGGLGGARSAIGFQEAGLDEHCTFITNVGDDLVVDDLLVCPDTDTVLYAMAGLFDDKRGWGIAGDSFSRQSTTHPWFGIGDADRAWQRRRQRLLTRGMPLHQAIAACAAQMRVRSRVLPATTEAVRTRIAAGGQMLGFQEWLVRDQAEPMVEAVDYTGLSEARPTPGVLQAIDEAGLIVLAPSSPVASILPAVSLPDVAEGLRRRREVVVAVSPIAARRPLATDSDRRRSHARAALMGAAGMSHQPIAVARRYRDLAARFILDPVDSMDALELRSLGLDVLIAPTVGDTAAARFQLVGALLPQSKLVTGVTQ